jgi:hypothetical protein
MQTLIEIENEKLSNETLDNQAVTNRQKKFFSFLYFFLFINF